MSFGPPVPGFINRVNFITSYFFQGCEAPFTLFCKFAAPPAGRAVAMLIGLDMGDIVKEFFRPAGLRSHRHGRKGPRGRKGLPELPDPNDAIAKHIPGQGVFAGRPVGDLTRWAFSISDNVDRVAWNLAIIDVVSDTVYQGLLGIISEDKENCPLVGRMGREGGFQTILNTHEGWGPIQCPELKFAHACSSSEYNVLMHNPQETLVTLQATLKNQIFQTTTCKLGIVAEPSGVLCGQSNIAVLEYQGQTTLSVDATVPRGQLATWRVNNTPGHVDILHASVTAFGLRP